MIASTGVPRAAADNWSHNIPVRLSSAIVSDLVENVEVTCKENVTEDRGVSSRFPSELHRKAKENIAEKVKIGRKKKYKNEIGQDEHVGRSQNSSSSDQISVEALIRRFREAQPLPREERLKAKTGKQKLWWAGMPIIGSREAPIIEPGLHGSNGPGVNTSGVIENIVNIRSTEKGLNLFLDDHEAKQYDRKCSELTKNATTSAEFSSAKTSNNVTKPCESIEKQRDVNEIVAVYSDTEKKTNLDPNGCNGHGVNTSGEAESLANASSKGKSLDLNFGDPLGQQHPRKFSKLVNDAADSSQKCRSKAVCPQTRSRGSADIQGGHNELMTKCTEIATTHDSGSANPMASEVIENSSTKLIDDTTEVVNYSVSPLMTNRILHNNDMNSINEVVASGEGKTSVVLPNVSEEGKDKTMTTQIEEEHGFRQGKNVPSENTNLQVSQNIPWKYGQRIRVRILWDIENLQVPKGKSAFSLATILYGVARQEASKLFVASPQAVSVRLLCFHNPDRRTISRRIRKELVAACCTLIDIGKGKAGQADNIICDEIGCIMEDFDPTYTMVMLITGDMDFVSNVRRLSEAKFKTFCVYPQHASGTSLRHQCFDQFSWKTLDWNFLTQRAQSILPTPPTSPVKQQEYQDSSNLAATAVTNEAMKNNVMAQTKKNIIRGGKNTKKHNESKDISQSTQKSARKTLRKKRANSKTKNVGVQCSPDIQSQFLPRSEVVQVVDMDQQVSSGLDFITRMGLTDHANHLIEENKALKQCQFLKTRIEEELSLLNERLQDTKNTTSRIRKTLLS